MAFNPELPANGSPLSSAEMRGQLTGLKTLLDAIPGLTGVVIDSVTTLPAGAPASVNATLTGTVLHLTFGIPAGIDGIEGPPGEVSTQQLDDAINGTSANTNGVPTLGITVSDPPTQGEMQQIADKMDEMILNGRR